MKNEIILRMNNMILEHGLSHELVDLAISLEVINAITDMVVKKLERKEVKLYCDQIIKLDEQLNNHSKQVNNFYASRMVGEMTNISTEKEVLSWLKKHDLYMLFKTNILIGFILIIDGDYKNTIYISEFVIDEKFRSRGYGRLLLEKVIKLIKNKNKKIDTLLLGVLASNKIAVKMYERNGFKIHEYTMLKSI